MVSAQLEGYVTAAALGAAAGAVYDLLRTVRLRRRRSAPLTHVLDAVFLLAAAPALLWYALRVGEGELRLVMLSAMGLGALVYLWALSPLVLPLWDFWLGVAAGTARLLWRPAAWLGAPAGGAAVTPAGRGGEKNWVQGEKSLSFPEKMRYDKEKTRGKGGEGTWQRQPRRSGGATPC